MKSKRFPTIPILSIGLYLVLATLAPAILPYLDLVRPNETFTISGSVTTATATSNDLVAVQPNEVLEIDTQVWVPSGSCMDFGPTVVIQPLDGGAVVNGSTTVTADGCGWVDFYFQAPANPGASQISLLVNGGEIGIQLWVVDPNDPTNQPPTIN